MENAETIKYLYQQSVLLEYLLLVGITVCILRPNLLVAVAASVMLLRPNERMALSIPFMQVLVPVLSLVLFLNAAKVRGLRQHVSATYLNFFVLLALGETLVLHTAEFVDVFIFVAVGYLLYYCILVFMADDAGAKLLCRTVALCCFLICLEPFYYHLTEPPGSQLWNIFHLPKSGRLQAWGMWGNANETAFLACMGIANLSYLAAKFKGLLHYFAALFLVPFFAVIIFLTASRAGFASLLLIFLPSILLARAKFVRILAVVAILCAVVVSHSMTPTRVDEQASSDARSELRRRGRILVEEHPVVGVGLLQARHWVGGQPLHNTYLEAFAETGVVGGLLLMTFLLSLGRNLYGVFKASMKASTNSHLVFIVGLYCSSMFYFLWGNQLLSIFFFLVVAQIITAVNTAAGSPEFELERCEQT